MQHLHGLRETWKKSRTQRIDLLRGILWEAGIEARTHLLGGVVPSAAVQWRLAKHKIRLAAGIIRKA